ncbi:hypothetical protein ACJX0J_018083, partial [Zea mays]
RSVALVLSSDKNSMFLGGNFGLKHLMFTFYIKVALHPFGALDVPLVPSLVHVCGTFDNTRDFFPGIFPFFNKFPLVNVAFIVIIVFLFADHAFHISHILHFSLSVIVLYFVFLVQIFLEEYHIFLKNTIYLFYFIAQFIYPKHFALLLFFI